MANAAPAQTSGNAPNIPNFRKRWSDLDTEWQSWRPVYADLSDFGLPFTGRFTETNRNLGNRRYGDIIDSTGSRAFLTLAAGLMSGMSSPARPWFRLGTADPDLASFQPVKLWLDAVQKRMLDLFQRTNTYQFLHTAYLELGLYGTAATFLDDDFQNVIHGYPLTCGEYRISANYRGEVDTLARKFQKTVAQLVREFGYANCSQATQNLFSSGNLDSWVTCYHLIEPRFDRDPNFAATDALHKAFASYYWEDGAATDETYLREGGYDTFPAICPRWQIFGGDIYGNSPGMVALGDLKALQHEQLRKAEGIDYQTKPPLQVPSALAGKDVNRFPGGITFYDGTPSNGIRSMFDVNLNLQYLSQDIQDVRQRINSACFVDLFLMLQNMDQTQMTATEVAERNEEKLTVLGPTLERLQDEALNPLVERTFARMSAAGLLPPPPPELQGQPLNVEFISMLAQAQRAVGVTATTRWLQAITTIAQINPQAVDVLNADEAVNLSADQLGVDPRMVNSDDQVAAIRQQRQQAAQAQAAQQAALTASTAAKNLGAVNTAQPNGLSDLLNLTSGYTLPQQ